MPHGATPRTKNTHNTTPSRKGSGERGARKGAKPLGSAGRRGAPRAQGVATPGSMALRLVFSACGADLWPSPHSHGEGPALRSATDAAPESPRGRRAPRVPVQPAPQGRQPIEHAAAVVRLGGRQPIALGIKGVAAFGAAALAPRPRATASTRHTAFTFKGRRKIPSKRKVKSAQNSPGVPRAASSPLSGRHLIGRARRAGTALAYCPRRNPARNNEATIVSPGIRPFIYPIKHAPKGR